VSAIIPFASLTTTSTPDDNSGLLHPTSRFLLHILTSEALTHLINPYNRNGINGSFSGDTLRGWSFGGSLRITSRPLSARGPQSPRDPSVCSGGSCEVAVNVSSGPPSDHVPCSGHSERVAKFLVLTVDGLLPVTISNPADYKKRRTDKTYCSYEKHKIDFMFSTCFGPAVPLQRSLKVIQERTQTYYDVYGNVIFQFRIMKCFDDFLWETG
jgi:hypothetical protein